MAWSATENKRTRGVGADELAPQASARKKVEKAAV